MKARFSTSLKIKSVQTKKRAMFLIIIFVSFIAYKRYLSANFYSLGTTLTLEFNI